MSDTEVRTEEFRVSGAGLVDKVKELVQEGNVRNIAIRNGEGKTLVDIPLTLGVLGTLVAPKLAALGAIVTMATDGTIVVERTGE